MKCLKLAKNAGALFAFAVAILPLVSAADGIIPVKSYSNKLTLTVNSTTSIGAALSAAEATVSELTGNVYDCIEKTGTGSLQMNESLAGFTGDIFVKAGRLDVSVNGGLGSATSVGGGTTNGFVVVENEAAVVWSGSTSLSAADKTMFIAGTGDDGHGAVQAITTIAQQKGVFGKCMILTADASAYVSGGNGQDIREDKTIVLNGFKLTIATDNRRTFAFRPNAFGPGKIELGSGTFAMSYELAFVGDASDELIANGATLQYSGNTLSLPWTLVIAAPTRLNLRGTESVAGEWSCPIRLGDTLTLSSGDTENPYIKLSGRISGTGGIFVKGADPDGATADAKGIKVVLANGENSFSGGLWAEYATLGVVSGALPVSGGTAAFTNSVLSVVSGDSVSLPPCKFAGVCNVENAKAANFASLDVADGASLMFDTVERFIVPGLWYGEDTSVSWPLGKTLGNTYNPSIAISNDIVMSLHKTEPSSTIGGAGLYTYSGYIINTDTVDRVWSFSGAVRYRSRLLVNGSVAYAQTAPQRYAGQATLHPGANQFLFQATTDGANTGIIDRKNSGAKTVTFGGTAENETDNKFIRGSQRSFLIDRQGRNPLSEEMMDASNWEVPIDPGDGSLFAIAVTKEEAASLGYATPSIVASAASFGVGSTIDVGGRDFTVGALTGIPAISNGTGSIDGNTVAVNGLWTIDDASLAASAVLESDRAISFGPSSTFSVVLNGQKTKYGRLLSVAHSDISIVGLPTCVPDESGHVYWLPSISQGGKILSLGYNHKGLVISFR